MLKSKEKLVLVTPWPFWWSFGWFWKVCWISKFAVSLRFLLAFGRFAGLSNSQFRCGSIVFSRFWKACWLSFGRELLEKNRVRLGFGRELLDKNSVRFGSGRELLEKNSVRLGCVRELLDKNSVRFGSGRELLEKNSVRLSFGHELLEKNSVRLGFVCELLDKNSVRFGSGRELLEKNSVRLGCDSTDIVFSVIQVLAFAFDSLQFRWGFIANAAFQALRWDSILV